MFTEEEMAQQSRHHERERNTTSFPTKFWITSDKKIHNVLGTSTYHIQHVVKNPKAFGFADEKDMMAERAKEAGLHAELNKLPEPKESPAYGFNHHTAIDDLPTYRKEVITGMRDIDHHVETAAMKKGAVRGTGYKDSWSHQLSFDAQSHEHAANALAAILPHIEQSEKEGIKEISVNYYVYPHGKGAPYENTEFTDSTGTKRKRWLAKGWSGSPELKSSKDIREHIEKIKGQETPPAAAPEAEEKPIGRVGGLGSSTVERAKGMKSLKKAGLPTWQAQRRLEGELGSWGDSVEHRGTFRSFFREMIERTKKGSWKVNSDIQRPEKPKGNKK